MAEDLPPTFKKKSEKSAGDARFTLAAGVLLVFMAILAGGAARRESVTIDEVAHIGAGVSYLQKLDLRLNEEHPPLPKVLAALPLVIRGTRADYSHISWTVSDNYFSAYLAQWVFGEWLLTKWNDPVTVLWWARMPMLLLMLALGWVLFVCARRLGGNWGGLLCLSVYASTPAFLAFGPLVHTDIAVTLFSLLTLWTFAETWQTPSRKNVVLFGLCLAGALLSKFTAGILFFAIAAFAVSSRWRAVPGQPVGKPEVRAWRKLRWRATLRGIVWAALIVYVFYFIFSLHETTDVLDRLGHSSAFVPLRRLLMPPWLYFRGVALVLLTSSRPTFILGHSYPHGVWFYFPVVFLLKSAPGFLGLIVLAIGLALGRKSGADGKAPLIPAELAIHWRAAWVFLVVFTLFCLLSRLDFSIRHFSIPLILIILLLAPLPRMIGSLRQTAPIAGLLTGALVGALTLSCFLTALRTYPYFVPYINAFSFGHPPYSLVNDSNLDWNQSLPEVKRFADEHGLQKIELDDYGFDDPPATIPQFELWNCQTPTEADEGQWVAVSANMIQNDHNCLWLMEYEHQSLAGGSMYAIHLPQHIAPAGSAGGPPLPSEFHQFAGAPFDMRSLFQGLIRHPETIPEVIKNFQAQFAGSQKK